ncbi:MoxR family ATPase [Microvirga sp. W0021]|uniref:MoxR family ATPase n=1 Tax=Hohaiivirga grylli TaxID=3133970 RepID=A0ABV0BJA8_9HYPH
MATTKTTGEALSDEDIAKTAEGVIQMVGEARSALQTVVFGQDKVLDLTLATIISGGHGLLVGVPGLAKTKLVEALGIVLGLDNRRIQFTPDLMPADILGSEILDEDADHRRSFRFVKGPIFTQLLMADEINRASPRTQSALLQSMQEHHVSISGQRYDLPHPFHVLATQNPIEQEGTYPLPEAQLDRFLMQIDITYPDREAERRILIETTGASISSLKPVLTSQDLIAAQKLVRFMPVGEKVLDVILDLVNLARPGEENTEFGKLLAWGAGPRASQALSVAARAKALMEGRLAPSVDDVITLAEPILKHRMALTYSARVEGETISSLISRMITRIKG